MIQRSFKQKTKNKNSQLKIKERYFKKKVYNI